MFYTRSRACDDIKWMEPCKMRPRWHGKGLPGQIGIVFFLKPHRRTSASLLRRWAVLMLLL